MARNGTFGHNAGTRSLRTPHLTHRDVRLDFSPVRRKDYRRRSKRIHRPPIKGWFQILLVASLTTAYYTCPNRALLPIIFMDALVVQTALRLSFAASAQLRNAAVERLETAIQVTTPTRLIPSLNLNPGFFIYLQRQRNRLMRSLNGNTVTSLNARTLCLDELIPATPPLEYPDQEQLQPKDEIFSKLKLSRDFLLQCRTSIESSPPVINTLPRPRLHRKGRRVIVRIAKGEKRYFAKPKLRNSRSLNSKPQLVSKPPPPQRGTPGATMVANEESKPHDLPLLSLLGRGSRSRCQRRRLYRQWRKSAGETIRSLGVGNPRVREDHPLRAVQRCKTVHNRAKAFRTLVLAQPTYCSRKKQNLKPGATPPLSYGQQLRIGTQNVQSMTEVLKHQSVLDLIKAARLDILILTETHAGAYHSFNSEGHLFVVNGNNRDKWAGVTAVISPKIVPYIKTIIQHTSRIIELVVAARSGDMHIIGAYAPHDKLDFESKKQPFWHKLQDIVSAIPSPEPYYLIGDFNVRLQGRLSTEHSILGPHVYGKGRLHANTKPESNRTLYTQLLKGYSAVDALTYKQPNLLKHVTFRDKCAPPDSWDQFILDPIGWLQLWDKLQATPLDNDEVLSIVSSIRSYVGADTLPPSGSLAPKVDSYRFQGLDRLVCSHKWLPSVHKVQAAHHHGFPSDHFPLIADICVKLGARTPIPQRPPAYDYKVSPGKIDEYNATIHSQLKPADPHMEPSPLVTPPTSENYVIYTDGSGTGGRCTSTTPAGWGFVIITDQEISHEARGPVDTDPSSAYHCGAMVGSNNTAEISALIEAALYLLGLPQIPAQVEFCYDSKWAADMTRGRFKPKRHKALVYTAKQVFNALTQRTTVQWRWVKGHTGEEYNEMADELAGAARKDANAVGGRRTQPAFVTPTTLPIRNTPQTAHPQTLEQRNQAMTEALRKAEQTHLQRLPRQLRSPWITPQLAEEMHRAKRLRQMHDPLATDATRQVKSRARKIKRDWLRTQIVHSSQQGTHTLWGAVRRLKQGFRARRSRLKCNGAPVPWSKTHEVFSEHLSQVQWGPTSVTQEELDLLKDSPTLHPPQSTPPTPFTMIELSDVIRQLKKNKAPGPDGVRAELIKHLNYVNEQALLDLLNECLRRERVPAEWKRAHIVTIFKGKGSPSDPASYRPISLLNTFYKIYAALLQRRLSQQHDQYLRQTQYGFRGKRSTSDPIFILRRAQDLAIKTGTPLHFLFLDWKMAFDKLDREAMCISLTRLGVHRQYVNIIKDLYTDQTFTIKGPRGESTTATPHTGIRKGCPLSPYLFIMVMTVLLADVDTRLRVHGVPTNSWSVGKPIYDIEYADDTLLISVTKSQAEELLRAIEVEATLYGLTLNKEKTELLFGYTAPGNVHFADGTIVPTTEEAKYLGTLVSWLQPSKIAIEARKDKAKQAYAKLQPLWRSALSRKRRFAYFMLVSCRHFYMVYLNYPWNLDTLKPLTHSTINT